MTLIENLKRFISHHVLNGEDTSFLDENTELIDSGVLDSLALTGLLAHIEKTVGLRVPPKDIIPAHFSSISAIARFLESLAPPTPKNTGG